MSSILDSRDQIKKLDQSNLLSSAEALPDQIQDAWDQTKDLIIPSEYQNIKNIVVSGMGGSALGSHLIKGLYKAELKIPFEVVSHYNLPGYVNSDTLVLLSSYSGTTEETLSASCEALERGAKIMVITSGGSLAQLASTNHWPLYLIKPTFNPSAQPRMAIGYAIAGQLAMFAKAGIIPDQTNLLTQTSQNLQKMIPGLSPENQHSPAKMLAYAAFDKHVIFVAAEHLIGAAHVTNNQFNENAKSLTSEWHLPEFNHHYLEALSFPKHAKETTIFFLYNSSLYHERVQKRVLITKEIIEQQGYEVQLIQATAPTKLEQIFEIIQLGEFVSCYLAILYGIDPSPIPSVDSFKSQMST